jgi:hypothetical protein
MRVREHARADDVHPPRAGWSKRLRPAGYRLRRVSLFRPLGAVADRVLPVTGVRVGEWRPTLAEWISHWRPALAAPVSVIPGLGHLLTGRLDRIRWLWPAWCGCLLVGLLFYGNGLGGLCIGVAVALHAWIVCDAGGLRQRTDRLELRIALPVLAFLLLFLGPYAGVRRVAGLFVRGGYSSLDLTAAGARRGDFLLVWRPAYRTEGPERGDVVLWRAAPRSSPGYILPGGEVLGAVVALPGDRVALKAGKVTVITPAGAHFTWNGGERLSGGALEMTLAPDRYFCVGPEPSFPGERPGVPGAALQLFIDAVLVVPRNAMEGKAFMVWNPIWRRKWLSVGLPQVEQDNSLEPIRQPGV